MLAANRDCSNVPPDDLQATPVHAVPAVSSHELGKDMALVGANANPAGATQQHTPGQQRPRLPVALPIEYAQIAVAADAQTRVSSVRAPQSNLLMHAVDDTKNGAAGRYESMHGQQQYHDQGSCVQEEAGE